MKNFKKAFIKKMKGFRPTIITLIMILLVTYRMFCSGKGIMLAGVCASIVPFICQLRNYPEKDKDSSELINILADYLLNIFYMIIYLAFILLVTWLGMKMNPSYVQYPYFWETMLFAVSENIVFISIMYTVGASLTMKQRLMVGLILTNTLLGVMMIFGSIVCEQIMINTYCVGFSAFILVLTLAFICLTYYQKKKS